MMPRQYFSALVVILLMSISVAHPLRAWDSNGWTTETGDKLMGGKKSAVDDTQGEGWVSSESGSKTKTKAVPTSWQQVDRHHEASVKSNGWNKAALNPASQDIANGFVIHHPIPNSNPWSQPQYALQSWNNQNHDEYWPEDQNSKISSTSTAASWDNAVATDASEQWQQNQKGDASKSATWANNAVASSTSQWNKDSSTSAWSTDVSNDRASAAGYAATGPAQYGQESNTWSQEKLSSSNSWQSDTPQSTNEAWKKDSTPSALYSAPSKWNSQISSGNSDWQKASNGWNGSSDLKTWQKETNGWSNTPKDSQNLQASSSWQQELPNLTTQKSSWQADSASNAWAKSSNSNGWSK